MNKHLTPEEELQQLRERVGELEFNMAGAILAIAKSHPEEKYLRHIGHLVVYGKDQDRTKVRPKSDGYINRTRRIIMARLKKNVQL